MERKNPVFTAFVYVCALLLAAVILAPLAWLFVMSISPAADLAAKPLRW
ncbi:MAG: carbohydrate ABC transporter permease, partial [Mesorhizobium sp.]